TDLAGNSEVILSRATDPNVGLGIGSGIYRRLNGGVGSRSGISKQLVNSYLCTDGKPISISSVYKGDTTIKQVVKNRDPRLKQTMWVPGQVRIDYATHNLVFKHPSLNKGGYELSTSGYMVRKG